MTDAGTRDYYDRFADRQVRVGINERHRAIQSWLVKAGLRPGMSVLELGCGVGTQTELIAAHLGGEGRILAVDISPRSVDIARQRLARRANVEFLTANVTTLALEEKFDAVVLPDILEHIPLSDHPGLFTRLRRLINDDGWVLIHMPNPLFLEWCHQHRPDLLQPLDQAIHPEAILQSIRGTGFYLHMLHTYSVWVPECDYQVVLLRVRRELVYHLQPVGSGPGVLDWIRRMARRAVTRLRR